MADRVYSEREAAAILEVAARRQGVGEPAATVGLTLSELESVAAGAGIERRHVLAAAAALVETGSNPGERMMGLQASATRSIMLERLPSQEEWGRIVAHFRRTFGALGVTSDVGEVRAWASAASEKDVPVNASLEPDGAGARLTLTQRPGDIIGVLTMIVVGVFVVLGTATLLFDAGSRWVGALILVLGATAYAGIRIWYGRSMRRLENQFDETLRLAAEVIGTPAESGATIGLPGERTSVLEEPPHSPGGRARS